MEVLAGTGSRRASSFKVSLHESQNVTHEYLNSDSPKEEQMPSIMDLLNERGPVEPDSESLQLPALMQALDKTRHGHGAPLTGTLRTTRHESRNYIKQDSMSVDDATRSVLSDVLAFNVTDESKNTPPLDFFAAAGVTQAGDCSTLKQFVWSHAGYAGLPEGCVEAVVQD